MFDITMIQIWISKAKAKLKIRKYVLKKKGKSGEKCFGKYNFLSLDHG